MNPSLMRKIFLGIFVVSWLVTDVLFWAAGLNIWAVLWLVIIGTVIAAEIYGMLTGSKDTISNRLGEFLKKYRKMGYGILAMMFVSWVALLLHLGWQ